MPPVEIVHNAYPDAIARPPVTPISFVPEGAFQAVRSDPSEGACGIHPYPCQHPGVDLIAPKGTVVAAPHSGWVLVSQATNDPPFAGYGPAVVLLAHDDGRDLTMAEQSKTRGSESVETYRYTLLAHLDPETLRYNLPWKQAQGLTDTDDSSRYLAVGDGTKARLKKWPSWAQHVEAGEYLGTIGDAHHVHWEIRTNPLRENGTQIQDLVDPIGWLHRYDPSIPWDTTTASPMAPAGRGNVGLGAIIKLAIGAYIIDQLM
jgi:hypothetical protein